MADLGDDDDEGGGVDDSWLATYGDMVTLLLCFFVLMYSMSVVDAKKFDATFSSVRDTFGGNQMENVKSAQITNDESAEQADPVRVREELLEAQKQTYDQIISFISQQKMDDKISATLDEGKIILRVPDDVLFDKGTEYLSSQAEPVLFTLLQIFHEKREQTINIKGYSDNSPVPTGSRFYDNWELSALRAVNVLRYYISAGIGSHRITATGMGELEPLVPNNSEINKARNRRVEFVLEREVKDF